jgi:large subunit ribosomal protein L18
MKRNDILKKRAQATRRAARTRAKIHGTADRPRMSVYRSQKHISVQLIDDEAGRTLFMSSDVKVKAPGKKPMELAALVGTDAAKAALAGGVKEVIFDRGSYLYHGRVKALAEAAREAGLQF